jgi:hypothetical protein
MATVNIKFPTGVETGPLLRRLAKRINDLAAPIPDNKSTGGTTTLTINNSPHGDEAIVSVQITSGPYKSDEYII